MTAPVVAIRDLEVSFPGYRDTVQAVRGVSLEVRPGEIVGLVGESGSGKTVTAMTILGLLPPPPTCRIAGSVAVLGRDVRAMSRRELESFRGGTVALVPQEPMTSLNPTVRVSSQLGVVIRRHNGVDRREARRRAANLLAELKVDDPERILSAWPHELSGGLRQRVLLAMAFSCSPKVLVADEPTTALDVTVQAQVLRLLVEQVRRRGVSVLFITHDMGVAWQVADRVYVMHDGEVVEAGATEEVLGAPSHAYTRRLLAALPERSRRRQPLAVGEEPA